MWANIRNFSSINNFWRTVKYTWRHNVLILLFKIFFWKAHLLGDPISSVLYFLCRQLRVQDRVHSTVMSSTKFNDTGTTHFLHLCAFSMPVVKKSHKVLEHTASERTWSQTMSMTSCFLHFFFFLLCPFYITHPNWNHGLHLLLLPLDY